MSKQELAALIAAATDAHISSGGKIKECLSGDHAVRMIPRNLWQCECGCHGDYTEHSMRAGEPGRCASIMIH